MRRNITMLHNGHVSRLEKSGTDRNKFIAAILDFDVHNSGDTKMVHFQGENEDVPKISSMAAR